MSALIFALALAAGGQPIKTVPVVPVPLSKDRYDVDCDLTDVFSGEEYHVGFVQRGGQYLKRPGEAFGGTLPVTLTATRDLLGLLGSGNLVSAGTGLTPWRESGRIELMGQNGSMTISKTSMVFREKYNPTTVAVTAKVGWFRNTPPSRTVNGQMLLAGKCKMTWETQPALTELPSMSGQNQ